MIGEKVKLLIMNESEFVSDGFEIDFYHDETSNEFASSNSNVNSCITSHSHNQTGFAFDYGAKNIDKFTPENGTNSCHQINSGKKILGTKILSVYSRILNEKMACRGGGCSMSHSIPNYSLTSETKQRWNLPKTNFTDEIICKNGVNKVYAKYPLNQMNESEELDSESKPNRIDVMTTKPNWKKISNEVTATNHILTTCNENNEQSVLTVNIAGAKPPSNEEVLKKMTKCSCCSRMPNCSCDHESKNGAIKKDLTIDNRTKAMAVNDDHQPHHQLHQDKITCEKSKNCHQQQQQQTQQQQQSTQNKRSKHSKHILR